VRHHRIDAYPATWIMRKVCPWKPARPHNSHDIDMRFDTGSSGHIIILPQSNAPAEMPSVRLAYKGGTAKAKTKKISLPISAQNGGIHPIKRDASLTWSPASSGYVRAQHPLSLKSRL
jgi:hypothetical protein